MKQPTGILLCNIGSPAALDEKSIRRFLSSLLSNKQVAPMKKIPWFFKLHFFLLSSVTKKLFHKYKSVWTENGSPLNESMLYLSKELQKELREEGFSVHVRPANAFGSYSFLESIKSLKEKDCGNIVAVPLFPQSSHSSTKLIDETLKSALKKMNWNVHVTFLDDYHLNANYITALSRIVEHVGFDRDSNDTLLCVYHSIPLSHIEQGDTYELQADTTSLALAGELGLDRKAWSIAYHGAITKKSDWLSPCMEQSVKRIAEYGKGRLFICCPGYMTENVFTLCDIRKDMRKLFLSKRKESHGDADQTDFVYVPCLGKSKLHVGLLKSLIIPLLKD